MKSLCRGGCFGESAATLYNLPILLQVEQSVAFCPIKRDVLDSADSDISTTNVTGESVDVITVPFDLLVEVT